MQEFDNTQLDPTYLVLNTVEIKFVCIFVTHWVPAVYSSSQQVPH